jgi:1,4-alpha-glucan branching enzyme
MFMGSEFGSWREWAHDASLEWDVLRYPLHAGVNRWVRDLNALYRNEPPLHGQDFSHEGFEWIDCHDWEGSTISFIRKAAHSDDLILVACNFTPVPRHRYRIGVPRGGEWTEVLNSDSVEYGGSGVGNMGKVVAEETSSHGRPFSVSLTIPPLGAIFLKSAGQEKPIDGRPL